MLNSCSECPDQEHYISRTVCFLHAAYSRLETDNYSCHTCDPLRLLLVLCGGCRHAPDHCFVQSGLVERKWYRCCSCKCCIYFHCVKLKGAMFFGLLCFALAVTVELHGALYCQCLLKEIQKVWKSASCRNAILLILILYQWIWCHYI